MDLLAEAPKRAIIKRSEHFENNKNEKRKMQKVNKRNEHKKKFMKIES